MNPLELASSRPWSRALFTTYALSLSFFEAVLLDRLVRGGTKQAVILSDPDGVKAALSEQGARRAGRDYQLEPVAPAKGYFHPKLSVFETEDDCHLLVGSGNLTFGGWGTNLETVEHLHPSFAPDAFDDLAELFQLLALDDSVRMAARHLCSELGDRLAGLPKGVSDGKIRLLHSVGSSIAAQLPHQAAELGGATRLTVAAPFFDSDSKALANLAQKLGLETVHVHAHPTGTVRGSFGSNWPVNCRVPVSAVCIDTLGADERHLHAKNFEILCKHGRLLLSGSANATTAAFGIGKNVECSVLRIDRAPQTTWLLRPASAPEQLFLPAATDEDADVDVGVLRAELNGEVLEGLLLRPRLTGPAVVSVVTQRQEISLGTTSIDASGRFKLLAPGLEMDSWSAGRLVVRLQQGERLAQGFLSLGMAFELARRAGPIGTRMAALLSGSETPDDVAAVFGWLAEDPTRVPAASQVGVRSSGSSANERCETVKAADLSGAIEPSSKGQPPTVPGRKAWERLYDMLRAAFRSSRGRFEPDDLCSDDNPTGVGGRDRSGPARRQIERSFPLLLTAMLQARNEGRHALLALDMTNYVCDRFEVETGAVKGWVQQCLLSVPVDVAEGDRAIITAASLLYFGSQRESGGAQSARRYLLQRSLLDVEPSLEGMAGLARQFASGLVIDDFRSEVLSQLTPGEEVSNYRRALDGVGDTGGFQSLLVRPQWPELAAALRDPRRASKFIFAESAEDTCSRCSISLPTGQQSDLRQFGVATATNCCRRIILCEAI